ncbi:MAG: RadC family protein [Clostridia bacterium]|nr:RadC family protein [Clostridia bacterium]
MLDKEEVSKVIQRMINKGVEDVAKVEDVKAIKSKSAQNHDGHRQRIIKKLEKDVLLDHELLEVFLFNAIPRKNTNGLAHALLAEFKNVRGVFNAKYEDLKKINGIGDSVAAYIVCAGRIFEKFYELENVAMPKFFENKSFSQFVATEYSKARTEVLDFYFMDKDRKIFNRQRFSCSDSSSVGVEPAEISKMLSANKPVGIVVVHNHPFGPCTPSKTDDETTAKFQTIFSFHNIVFCDHFICGTDGVYSYYMAGKMSQYAKKYSILSLIKEKDEN